MKKKDAVPTTPIMEAKARLSHWGTAKMVWEREATGNYKLVRHFVHLRGVGLCHGTGMT